MTLETYDLDALADAMMGVVGGGTDTQPEPESADPNPAEPSQPEEPNPQEVQAPPPVTDLEAYYQSRLQQDTAAYTQSQEQKVLEERLAKIIAGDEDEARAIGVEIARAAVAQRESQTVAEQATTAYTTNLLKSLITDEFIGSLTDAEKAKLDPDKGLDQLLLAVVDIKAAKAAASAVDSTFEERVKEAATARLNEQRGQQLRSSSPSAIPAARPGEDNRGKDGRTLMDEAFREMREAANT